LADTIAHGADEGQGQGRRSPDGRRCRGGRPVGKGGGESEGRAKDEEVDEVSGEEHGAAPLGQGEGDRAVGSIKEWAVERGGHPQDPVWTQRIRIPDAGRTGAAELEPGEGARSGSGGEGEEKSAIESTVGADGGIALADATTDFAGEG
jgi:hypothetical protein